MSLGKDHNLVSQAPEPIPDISKASATHIEQVPPLPHAKSIFLSLPRDLRDQIYILLFHRSIPIYPSSRSDVTLYINLLLTNRQIYTEAIPILYSFNTFQIRGSPSWKASEFLNLLAGQRRELSPFSAHALPSSQAPDTICLARHALKRLYIPSHGITLSLLKYLFSLLKYFPNLDYLEVVFLGSRGLKDMDVVNVVRLLKDRRIGIEYILRKRIGYLKCEDLSWMVEERPCGNWGRVEGERHVWRNGEGFERVAELVEVVQRLDE